jgi:glycerophosphoryl diester phosphodiesterase
VAKGPELVSDSAVPIAIAHRGDPIAARENTLPSFVAARRQGADMIELDLRRSRDGEIVVLHDPTLERLWGVARAVVDLDLAQLNGIGQAGERIPTFRQVLEEIDLPIMVDFTGRDVVEGALVVARQAGAMERCLFVTGNVHALRALRSLAPEARIGVTWVKPEPPDPSLLIELGAEYWNPMFRLVTPERVADVHQLGVKVSTWTVDQPRHMRRLVAAGVDAIVSNRIGALLRQLT